MQKLFVRNLSWSVTEDELNQLFSQAGSVVSVKIPTNRDTGRSRGFAFVEMSSSEDGQKAIQQLNGTMLHDRDLVVMEQTENASGGSSGGAAPVKQPKLFIRNVCSTVTEEQLQTLFAQAGTVVSVKIPVDNMTGQQKNFGFVEMSNADEAERAVETLNYTPLGQMEIVVNYQDPNRAKKPARSGYGGGGSRGGYGGGGYGGGYGGGGGYDSGYSGW